MKSVLFAFLGAVLVAIALPLVMLRQNPTEPKPAVSMALVPAPQAEPREVARPNSPLAQPKRVPAPRKAKEQNVKTVWLTDFDAAMKQAKKSGKPVFVDFYTDWCGACKYLDQTTYRDPKFARESQNWVMVKINAEKGKRNIEIAQKYKPEGFPTLLMLDANGKKLNQIAGAYPTNMMLDEMKKAQMASGLVFARGAAPLELS